MYYRINCCIPNCLHRTKFSVYLLTDILYLIAYQITDNVIQTVLRMFKYLANTTQKILLQPKQERNFNEIIGKLLACMSAALTVYNMILNFHVFIHTHS